MRLIIVKLATFVDPVRFLLFLCVSRTFGEKRYFDSSKGNALKTSLLLGCKIGEQTLIIERGKFKEIVGDVMGYRSFFQKQE